jgi:hypothetical protein
MADTKITALATITSLADSDLFAFVDDVGGTPVSRSVRADNVRSFTKTFYATTTAETNAAVAIADPIYRPGDTQRYTNGLADAISVAEDAAATEEEKDILFSASESISSTINIVGDNISVRAQGDAKITYTGTGDCVNLGASGTLARGLYWDVPLVKSITWADGTDTTSRGLVLLRCDQSYIVVDIDGFNNGFVLYGTGGGNVHNEISIRLINDCRIGFLSDRGTPAGWNNSNMVRNGLITYRSSTMDTAITNSTVTKNIHLSHASDNEIQFDGVGMEVATTGAETAPAGSMVIDCNGTWHRFLGCRIETSNITWTQYVQWDTAAQFCRFDVGRSPSAITTASFLADNATQNNNTLLNFANYDRLGTNRAFTAGVIKGAGNPQSAQYQDGTFPANVVCGPNTNTHTEKVWACIGSGGSIQGGATGQGRFGFGKDPDAASYGHVQIKDPDTGFDTESVNTTTFIRSTTDATPQTFVVDGLTIPEYGACWIEMTVVCFDTDSAVGIAQKRAAFIQRVGTGNLALNAQGNIYSHTDGGPATAVFAVSGTSVQITLTGIASESIRWAGKLEWQYCDVAQAFGL